MKDHANIWNMLKGSHFVGVMSVVALINIVFLVWSPLESVSPEKLPSKHSWVWWKTQDFLKQDPAPDIVFLGSSVLLHPLAMLDANHLNRKVDYALHHRVEYLEDKLAERTGSSKPTCFNFALPGGMVSDDWIVSEALFKGAHKPSLIVLGLTARDFMDAKVKCAGVTPAFKYLRRFVDVDEVVDLALPQPRFKANYLTGKYLYLWGKQLDLQVLASDATRAVVRPVLKSTGFVPEVEEEVAERLAPTKAGSELEPGWMIEAPGQQRQFSDNTEEYRGRYRHPHKKLHDVESIFFEKLLASAKKRGIEVLLVNVPVTSLNRQMLPAGVYDRYKNELASLSKKYDFPLLDLDENEQYSSAVYYDTVHMNEVGGRRLVDRIAQEIVGDEKLLTALEGPAKTNARLAGKSSVIE